MLRKFVDIFNAEKVVTVETQGCLLELIIDEEEFAEFIEEVAKFKNQEWFMEKAAIQEEKIPEMWDSLQNNQKEKVVAVSFVYNWIDTAEKFYNMKAERIKDRWKEQL